MGITGELVRSVFSKSRSTKTPEINNMKGNYSVEKRRWKASVKSYLCGDDIFNSVLAEEDSASVKSSEASVTQTLPYDDDHDDHDNDDDGDGDDDDDDDSTTEDIQSQDHSSCCSKSAGHEGAAATVIQSAFRGFKVRCIMRKNDSEEGMQSPSRKSLATSIEVQTGNSIQEKGSSVSTKPQQKPKPSTFKPKEDWDDSTLDSTRAKMRTQNRLEAMTRRERALAYAFSQQLRICSKKQHTKSDGTEPSTGWSWLERWMATRQTEVSPVDDYTSKQLINNEATSILKTQPSLKKKKFLNLPFEEKESCGSNEVPVHNEISPNSEKEDKDCCKSARNSLKAPRSISRRKTLPTYHYQKDHSKVNKKDGSKELEKDRRQKAKQSESSSLCKDGASSWLPPDCSVSNQNSKSDPYIFSKAIQQSAFLV